MSKFSSESKLMTDVGYPDPIAYTLFISWLIGPNSDSLFECRERISHYLIHYFLSQWLIAFSLAFWFRLTQCRVSFDDDTGATHEVFPIHSFNNNDVCFDAGRLNVVQTQFQPDTVVDMRTFRFRGSAISSNAVQTQTIECILHLDPIANLIEAQAADCTCHTNEECICASCDSNASCATSAGVTACSCDAGFNGDGTTCGDDNECDATNPTHNCDANATCGNIDGGFTCKL